MPHELKEGQPPLPLQWYCAPESWPGVDDAGKEGFGGKWRVETNNDTKGDSSSCVLELYPPTKKDFWRRTFYEPLLVKDDGPFLYTELSCNNNDRYTITTTFRLFAQNQFDQAGIVVRLDHEHWIKTGIEVVDGKARLSCVVTNVYSDWSTQPWASSSAANIQADEKGHDKEHSITIVDCTIRVHCRGQGNFVVESRKPNETEWEFLRICHLSRAHVFQQQPGNKIAEDASSSASNQHLDDDVAVRDAFQGTAPAPDNMWIGVFGCCPVKQPGNTKVKFQHLQVVRGSDFDHNADELLEE